METSPQKIVLITGSTGGIGKESATQLLRKGYTVIIHGRTLEKAQAVAQELSSLTGSSQVKTCFGDFDSFAEVKQMADKLKQDYDHLDVLINNAGAGFFGREVSKDGHEKTMNTNVFAPFLLTYLLLPLLNKSKKKGRIICVTSLDHAKDGEIGTDNLEMDPYNEIKAYHHSKRYCIWIHKHFINFSKENGFDNISINYCHPGIARTNLNRDLQKNSWKYRLLLKVAYLIAIPIDKAAYSSVYLASSDEVEGKDELYIGPKGAEQINWTSFNEQNNNNLWNYCMKITEGFRDY